MIATPTRTPVRPHVTQAQLEHCHPIWDYQRNEWFYQVDSESDPTKEPYEVRYHAHNDTYTCTCPCGQHAFASCKGKDKGKQYCKHVYWCCAHYQRYHRPQYQYSTPSVADVLIADIPELALPPKSDVAVVAEEDSWLNEEKFEPLTRWHNYLYPKQV